MWWEWGRMARWSGVIGSSREKGWAASGVAARARQPSHPATTGSSHTRFGTFDPWHRAGGPVTSEAPSLKRRVAREEPITVSHSITRARRSHESTEALEARAPEDREERPRTQPAGSPAGGSQVGWRYGSALAAARALNAQPARA